MECAAPAHVLKMNHGAALPFGLPHSATGAQAKKALGEEEKAKIYFIPHGPHQLGLAQ